MIVSGRAITLAMLGLCILALGAPTRAEVYDPRVVALAQSGAKPRPKPLPPPRPIPLPYPIRPLPPAPPPRPNPSLVRVPDLRGQTPQQAGPILRATGLVLGRQGQVVSRLQPPGRIVDTRPGALTQVQRDSVVNYDIARAPPPPPPPPIGIIPPLRPPPFRPPPLPPPPPKPPGLPAQSGGGQGEPPRPVTPPPIQPAPVQPAPIQPIPVQPVPVQPVPVQPAPIAPSSSGPAASSAPASSAPASSAAPGAVSASPAIPLPASSAPPAPTPQSGSPAASGPLAWAQTHPGWLAALAAVLAAGAAAAGWALRRRPVLPSATVIPILPVTVTASMLAVPTSTIENPQPATGPAIGIAWRVDPPETRIESQTTEEPRS